MHRDEHQRTLNHPDVLFTGNGMILAYLNRLFKKPYCVIARSSALEGRRGNLEPIDFV